MIREKRLKINIAGEGWKWKIIFLSADIQAICLILLNTHWTLPDGNSKRQRIYWKAGGKSPHCLEKKKGFKMTPVNPDCLIYIYVSLKKLQQHLFAWSNDEITTYWIAGI